MGSSPPREGTSRLITDASISASAGAILNVSATAATQRTDSARYGGKAQFCDSIRNFILFFMFFLSVRVKRSWWVASRIVKRRTAALFPQHCSAHFGRYLKGQYTKYSLCFPLLFSFHAKASRDCRVGQKQTHRKQTKRNQGSGSNSATKWNCNNFRSKRRMLYRQQKWDAVLSHCCDRKCLLRCITQWPSSCCCLPVVSGRAPK